MLAEDLRLMKFWFDPIASGKRLRDILSSIEPLGVSGEGIPDELLLAIDSERWLVTPEGRAVMWAIEASVDGNLDSFPDQTNIYISQGTIRTALVLVHDVYRDWNLQRITGVTGLLSAETATLRPTAAGLLLVLLLNRNTSPQRRLPPPDDPNASAEMTRAIAAPAIAFARELAGTEKASSRGVDLYRGWAMGEIARRLGAGLHRASDGVWIDPDYEDAARQRLIDALSDRPDRIRRRLPRAVDAALGEYERVRPVLSGLGMAHERPSNTRRLRDDIVAASGGLSEEGAFA
ncbi:hypothetical protein [Microbacterium sp. BDGP8]|uniref:hypothetical protein n=1 Tax=Microbacterium sp. BDGP8 TaxID=3035531 RepID=UPI00249F4AD2|nr:hypothetical protein [Microbacterium sp. BDGP8]WHE37206.1 hypothetical protein P6897_05685 [Microbacterium sp. BDGP8]